MEIEAEVDLYAIFHRAVKDAFTEVRNELDPNHPIYMNLKQGGIMPTPNTTDLILDFGYPPAGWVWDVRHAVASRSDPSINDTSGKVFICGGKIPGSGVLIGADPHDPFNVWTSTNNIPADASFAQHEFIIHHSMNLFVIWKGYTAGTGLAAHFQIIQNKVNQPIFRTV